MEFEWNYDIFETGTTVTVTEISTELRELVTPMFRDNQNYHDLELIARYQQVFETLTYFFENRRQRFQDIMTQRMGDLNQEQQQVEAIVFCSWVSLEVMTALSNQYIET